MANSNKTDNYDVVGGIFDFIFKESSKPPQKRRPVYPSGNLSGMPADDKLIAADLLAALAAPGVFVSNTALEEFKGALDIELLNLNMDENGGIKVKATGIKDLIKDPVKFVESSYQRAKSNRRKGRALFLGGALTDFVANAWAHKYGNKEAQKAVLAGTVANQKAELYIVSRALGQYQRGSPVVTDLDFMSQRSFDLLGRKTFKDQWGNISQEDKNRFANLLSSNSKKADIEKYLVSKYGVEQEKNFSRAASGGYKSGITYGIQRGDLTMDEVRARAKKDPKSVYKRETFEEGSKLDISDPNLYRNLERNNLVELIQTSDGPEKEMYERVLFLLEANKPELKKKLNLLKEEIRTTTDHSRKSLIEEELKDTKALLGVLDTKSIAGELGQGEGYINSIRNVVIGKGVNPIKSILDQSFFDKRKNTHLNPLKESSIGGGLEKIEFLSAKSSGSGLLNKFNKTGETLYYTNPRTWVRTLVTGEGFAWIANNKINSAIKIFGDVEGFKEVSDYAKTFLEITSFDDLNKGITTLMNRIKLTNANKKLSPEQLKSIENLLNSTASFRKLAHRFSRLKRWATEKQKIFLDATENLRKKIVKMLEKSKLFQKLFEKLGTSATSTLLKEFIAKGSIKALVKSFVTAIATAIGIPTTGPGSLLIAFATQIVVEIAWRVGKFLVKAQVAIAKFQINLYKLLLLGFVGIIILIFSMGSGSYNKYNRLNTSYANVIPGQVEKCEEYEEVIDPIDPTDPTNPFDPPVLPYEYPSGGDIQQIFASASDYVSRTYRPVSTQLKLVNCPGGEMCESIGWAWCYSSTSIYCKGPELASVLGNPNYLYDLFVHELLHQIQGSCGGNTNMHEWGADYLSNNGGRYMFTTLSGCKRATQIGSSSCTPQQIVDAALCWDTSTQCYIDILDQIINRFCQ